MIDKDARRVLSRVLAYYSTVKDDQEGNGMRTTRVWLLGVEQAVIESVELEPDGRGG